MLETMFNVGGPEVIVILVLALLVLGPDRLPGAFRQVGKAIAELRRVSADVQQDLRETLDAEGLRESMQTLRETLDVRQTLLGDTFAASSAPPRARTGRADTSAGDSPFDRAGGSTMQDGRDVPAPDGAASEGHPDFAEGGTAVPPPTDDVRDVLSAAVAEDDRGPAGDRPEDPGHAVDGSG